MRLKTFRAPTLPAALAQAREACGPEALVLATNDVPGRFGLGCVEITVAVGHAPAPAEVDAIRRAAEKVRETSPEPTPAAVPSPPPAPTATATARPDRFDSLERLDPALRSAAGALVRSGLSEDLALRFARIAADRLGDARDGDALSAAAEDAMGRLLRFAPPRPSDGGVVFVVGPPGAGKTSTVVKLAARFRAEGRGPVRIVNADRGNPGAAQRLRALARKQGVAMTTLPSDGDLKRVVGDRRDGGVVLVDTTGIGAADRERADVLRAMCRLYLDAEVLLVIPAGLHRDEVGRISRRFAPLHPSAAVISRVDDGGLPGEVVTGVADAGLPLGLVTTGRTIPTDLEDASPRRLAALLLRAGFRADGVPTEIRS